MTDKRANLGFGFKPDESRHHILVCIPEKKDGGVIIYERFSWQEEGQQTINVYGEDKAKAEISKHKWKLLEEAFRTEFNSRLKKNNCQQVVLLLGKLL